MSSVQVVTSGNTCVGGEAEVWRATLGAGRDAGAHLSGEVNG
jgi:hypothetical protein